MQYLTKSRFLLNYFQLIITLNKVSNMSVNSPSLAQTQLNTIYAQVQSGSVESPEFPALNMGIANTLTKVND